MSGKYKAFETKFAEDGSVASVTEIKPIENGYVDLTKAFNEYFEIEKYMGRKFLPVTKEPRDIQDEKTQRLEYHYKGLRELIQRRFSGLPNRDDFAYWQHLKNLKKLN
jgi:hypothetical protein